MRITVIISLLMTMISCEGLFQYSPYDADVSESNVNLKNILGINHVESSDTLWFVAIADIHHFYDELDDAIKIINSLSNINFVVVCGDLTDLGLSKEFEWYNQTMKGLKAPYVTVIGNHDYLSNGIIVYKKMFGAPNFTFDIDSYHFIGFDDIVWENDNTLPDFEWLNDNLKENSQTIQVVFAHLPPWSSGLDFSLTDLEKLITKKPDNVLVIHGHEHNSCYNILHAHHIVVGCMEDREMQLIGICDSTFISKQILF